jgi:hypothetical protein
VIHLPKIIMGFFAKLLNSLPTNAVLSEKVKILEAKNAELQKQLDSCRQAFQALQKENRDLAGQLAEGLIFHMGTEFRRGRTTGNEWQAFCPVCHLPTKAVEGYERLGLICCKAPICSWKSEFSALDLSAVILEVQKKSEAGIKNLPSTI